MPELTICGASAIDGIGIAFDLTVNLGAVIGIAPTRLSEIQQLLSQRL